MKISIDDNRKILEIQEEFSALFPYLKIEFFSSTHKPSCASAKKFIKHGSKTLNECRSIHKKGKITITPDMTVAELEQTFGTKYGLVCKSSENQEKLGWKLQSLTAGL